MKNKRTGGLAQEVEPEFNSQYCKNKQKEKEKEIVYQDSMRT
jgi:hypothetical protein